MLGDILFIISLQQLALSYPQENSEKHYNEIRNNIIVQKKFFTKETEAQKN